MFETLRHELQTIRTLTFHVVDGPASAELRVAIANTDAGVPRAYKAFVLEFGNAKLYRHRNYYRVEVYAGPREAKSVGGEDLINFGRTHEALAYFKTNLLEDGEETPVFEWDEDDGLVQVASGFSDWFELRTGEARVRYSDKEWALIEAGPEPFTPTELRVVEARKRFTWKIAGISPEENIIFEVTNGSDFRLPYLSVDVRGKLRPPKSGPLLGTVYIPVSRLGAGETGRFEVDCYKRFVDPKDVTPLEKPDPRPEERNQYKEFLPLPP